MVLTNMWMFNVEADWDGPNKICLFKKMKWRMPIEAITHVEITEADGMLTLTLRFDFLRNNTILVLN
jgi:hypothetical protein